VEVRLADLLAGLSRLADLGFGLQAGEALRSCALATRLARSLDLPEDDVRAAFYTALLHHVGCTGYAYETAQIFGDELALNVAAGRTNPADPRDVFATFLPTLLRGRPPLERARLALTTFTRGNRFGEAYTTAACEVARDAARRLRLPEAVQRSVYHVYEEWRGGGVPSGLVGDDLPAGSRLARLTGIAVLFDTPSAGSSWPSTRCGGAAAPCWTRGWPGSSRSVPRRCSVRSARPTLEPSCSRPSPRRWCRCRTRSWPGSRPCSPTWPI
jgi:hypothetical protein